LARVPGAEFAGVLACICGVAFVARVAFVAGVCFAVDAGFPACEEVTGERGVLFDLLVLDEFTLDEFEFVAVPGLVVVFGVVGLAVVVEPAGLVAEPEGVPERGVWDEVEPEAEGAEEPEPAGGAD
jgi:hypothetical protein